LLSPPPLSSREQPTPMPVPPMQCTSPARFAVTVSGTKTNAKPMSSKPTSDKLSPALKTVLKSALKQSTSVKPDLYTTRSGRSVKPPVRFAQ
jgi:hypothetical protein